MGAEGAHGVAGTGPCVWNDSTSLKFYNPHLTCSSECSLASVTPATASHDCDGLPLQEERTATSAEGHGTKLGATTLTTQMCHFDGYTYADTGSQFSSCVTTALLQCSDSTIAQTEKFDALELARLASWVALLATSLLLATVFERSRVHRERERCLPNWVPACLPGDALLDQHKPCANWSERGL